MKPDKEVGNFLPGEPTPVNDTDIVLKSVGTCLNDVKKRYDFNCQSLVTEIKNNYRIEFSQKYSLYYACLHVRANDMLFSMGTGILPTDTTLKTLLSMQFLKPQ